MLRLQRNVISYAQPSRTEADRVVRNASHCAKSEEGCHAENLAATTDLQFPALLLPIGRVCRFIGHILRQRVVLDIAVLRPLFSRLPTVWVQLVSSTQQARTAQARRHGKSQITHTLTLARS